MKYIRIFENNITVGEYVLININGNSTVGSKEFMNFINNNIGRIIKIKDINKWSEFNIYVEYENVPYDIKNYSSFIYNEENDKPYIIVRRGFIIANHKDKNKLEAIIAAKKFNL